MPVTITIVLSDADAQAFKRVVPAGQTPQQLVAQLLTGYVQAVAQAAPAPTISPTVS